MFGYANLLAAIETNTKKPNYFTSMFKSFKIISTATTLPANPVIKNKKIDPEAIYKVPIYTYHFDRYSIVAF